MMVDRLQVADPTLCSYRSNCFSHLPRVRLKEGQDVQKISPCPIKKRLVLREEEDTQKIPHDFSFILLQQC